MSVRRISGRCAPRRFAGAKRSLARFALLGFVACSGGAAAAPLPPQPTELTVAMSEYRFEGVATLPWGRVVVHVRNAGRLRHEFLLVRLPDDLKGSFDEQLHSSKRRVVDNVTLLPVFEPGDSTAFAVDLGPGRYGLVCFLGDPDGTNHALKGMNAELLVE